MISKTFARTQLIRDLLISTSIVAAAISSTNAFGALRVFTTTSDLEAIVAEIGADDVDVEAFAKGTQDPHFLEAKPSYIVKASRADLIVAVGLGLEVGWLPNVIAGSRSAKLAAGQSGYLEVGPAVELLEKAAGAVTRADGDVHPEGNPHVTLDPLRAGQIAGAVAARLAQLDPANGADYKKRAEALRKRLEDKTEAWRKRVAATSMKGVITYHKTLNYFLDRFGLKPVAYLEPLPGVPPTAKHIMSVIAAAKSKGVKLVLVENLFDETVATRLSQDVPGLKIVSVPVAVGGEPKIKTLDDLYEALVKTIEAAGSGKAEGR